MLILFKVNEVLNMNKPNFRTGIGYDLHRLEDNCDLIIGGVKIPYEKGLLGHSDADVLVHAIIDALLGALALPDIGTLFPDTDEKYKGANSVELLKKVYSMVIEKGYLINNLDANIIAQAPKMMPYIPKMKEKLASVLELNINDISIKAKTKEHLDAVGEKRAIESQAIVLVYKV
jgi:2-C-methyl-D-erythritol 2,4-cyclodiphosphate synthase